MQTFSLFVKLIKVVFSFQQVNNASTSVWLDFNLKIAECEIKLNIFTPFSGVDIFNLFYFILLLTT
jgi:hypothetical protein